MMIQSPLELSILEACGAKSVHFIEEVQSLWSGWGSVSRYAVEGCDQSSIVVKHVQCPEEQHHPRGWVSDFASQRKVKSFEVECAWYQHYSAQCSADLRVPFCFGVVAKQDQFIMVLEDLDQAGFAVRKVSVTLDDVAICLRWLANFHGQFMGISPDSLWSTGTYWHLETRPDELKVLGNSPLAAFAVAIDQALSQNPFQTIVHGDAKLANFCFSQDSTQIAAVDFQYVGGGIGMKDVVYFLGSCLNEAECEAQADIALDVYFDALKQKLRARNLSQVAEEIEQSWRPLFPVAWADFHRFLKGWSPQHWKINSYSERLTQMVIHDLQLS